MRFCDHCLAPLSQDATHCPECGLPVTSGTDDPLLIAEEERLVNPRLAQANLLRMRGQWEEAMRVCAGVLRQFPSNVHAHALMGDIYRDQGNLEEAAQWYKLALDLAPDSVVDRQKLEQVQRELELQSKAERESQEVQHLHRQARMLRIFSAAVIGVAVLIAIGITWAFQSRIARGTASTSLSIATSRLPEETVSVPSPTLTVPQPSNAAQTPPQGNASTEASKAPVSVDRQPRTQDDLLAAQIVEWLKQHQIHPVLLTVTSDPLSEHLLVSFGYTAPVSKDILWRTAWLAAVAVFTIQPEVQTVRVRCLVPAAHQEGEPVLGLGFVGDLSRKQLPSQPVETPAQEIPKFFQNVYVSPLLP